MDNEFVKTDNPNYLINKKTNMVINTKESDLLSYRTQVGQALEIKSLKQDYNNVFKELDELKSMVSQLLKK